MEKEFQERHLELKKNYDKQMQNDFFEKQNQIQKNLE